MKREKKFLEEKSNKDEFKIISHFDENLILCQYTKLIVEIAFNVLAANNPTEKILSRRDYFWLDKNKIYVLIN